MLRSALDNLIFQLALRTTATPVNNIAFPIFGTAAGFQSKAISGSSPLLRDITDANQRTLIEQTQPYQAGNGGADDPLILLRELNNRDKHRLIAVVIMVGRTELRGGTRPGDPPFAFIAIRDLFEFKDGAEFYRIEASRCPEGTNFPVPVTTQLSLKTFFDESFATVLSYSNMPLEPIVIHRSVFDDAITNRVTGILNSFEPII